MLTERLSNEHTHIEMPRARAFDSTTALLTDPYRFISNGCKRFGTDAFECRIFLRRTICMSGARAAEVFYDAHRCHRQGAAPEPLRATLFGKGAIQGLDGPEHSKRKHLLILLTSAERVSRLGELFSQTLLTAARRWTSLPSVNLYHELHEPLARAVCAWAGVPLSESQLRRRTADLVALFDQAAALPGGHLRSRMARWRTERWLASAIRLSRKGGLSADPDSACAMLASYTDTRGQLLPPRIAAVELLNLLRPTVAVSVFIVFAAHALQRFPAWQSRLLLNPDDEEALLLFVQEVRRDYPFFPAVVARVREEFAWQGMRFPRGRRVMFDLYGTNHDERAWDSPGEFRPERFAARQIGLYEMVPQGGGPLAGHRCPGEAIAIDLMKRSVRFLTGAIEFDVPPQDLNIDYGRLPALPRSGFQLAHVRLRPVG